nr:hypothetical protein [Clostridia bacterium]
MEKTHRIAACQDAIPFSVPAISFLPSLQNRLAIAIPAAIALCILHFSLSFLSLFIIFQMNFDQVFRPPFHAYAVAPPTIMFV